MAPMSDAPRTCDECGADVAPDRRFCSTCGMEVLVAGQVEEAFLGKVLVDKYRVEERLGSGSMGEVFRAVHLGLGADVAIKVLKRHMVGDANIARRFRQEARAASRIQHENAVRVIDFGALPDGDLYMAMEYVEGRDLCEVLAAGPLSAARAADVVAQACAGLDEGHANGVVHRDVKPSNILVAPKRGGGDIVKVLDFGIAKILDPDLDASVAMTRAGFVVGTPKYMSPEQVMGLPVSSSTDIL